MFCWLPDWNIVKDLLQPFATLIVGLLLYSIYRRSADISEGQVDIAEAKLSLDLFEKRYEIFIMVWDYLSNTDKFYETNYIDFTNKIPIASFLFGQDIERYMNEILMNGMKLRSLNRTSGVRALTVDEMSNETALFEWFRNEASTGVKNKFGKYMQFSRWHSLSE